jgi:hypothetical protein
MHAKAATRSDATRPERAGRTLASHLPTFPALLRNPEQRDFVSALGVTLVLPVALGFFVPDLGWAVRRLVLPTFFTLLFAAVVGKAFFDWNLGSSRWL